jgi:predicted flap endonuclease-1-like 5' DNA nuclease
MDRPMSLLFTVLYAAHANGTHHKLALDALRYLPRGDAEPWRRVFLKFADVYLSGAKAPDDEFKDFKNHVLHVRDGYWGGAPEKVASWYGHLVEALREQDFERAVYAAGVLSHYYTDPIQPFHTGQSEAENSVHRAVEWSISRSYDSLLAEGEAKHRAETPVLPSGGDWLRAHVLAGADRANPHYETLITHYDLKTGVREPASGLNPIARDAVAGLLIYAAHGFALILDRAITEAGVEPPEVSLTAATVLAGLKMPAGWIAKKITDRETRRQVQAMYDELMTTGRVEATLPEDDRIVRDLYAREVLAPRQAAQDRERASRLAVRAIRQPPRRPTSMKSAAPAGTNDHAAPRAAERAAAAEVSPAGATPVSPVPTRSHSTLHDHAHGEAMPRFHLVEGDELERAPSIGPKLAERLALGGIVTVKDFLGSDPETVVSLLGGGRFDADTVERWKSEARLVLQIAGLRGGPAQLMAGAGYDTLEKIAEADPSALSSAVLSFAMTPHGARILRNGDAPDIEAVTKWVHVARQAIAA